MNITLIFLYIKASIQSGQIFKYCFVSNIQVVQYSSTQISISHYFRITDRILIVNKTVIPMYRLKHYSNQGRNVRGYHHHQQIGRLRPAVALCTISLQPSLSCASRTASLMPILVSWRMSSQNRVLGRPLPLGPKTMPVRSTLSRLSLRRGGAKIVVQCISAGDLTGPRTTVAKKCVTEKKFLQSNL